MNNVPKRTNDDFIESASVTALMRYLLSNKEGREKNPDGLGNFFVGGKWKEYLKDPEKSIEELQKKIPGCIYYHLIRTKFFDQSLETWIEEQKNSQVVILGTGFDSRSIRFIDILKKNKIKVYEVDLERMINYKKKIIEDNFNLSVDHVTWVPCNFQKDNIIEKLKEHNFQTNVPTLILWEGVTYFLEEEVVKKYLQLFINFMETKLQITLDYAFKDYIEGDLSYYGAKELYEILVELGEPHFFGVNYNNIEKYFSGIGYQTKTNLTAQMLEALYLKDEAGKSAGQPHTFHGMVEITNNKIGENNE